MNTNTQGTSVPNPFQSEMDKLDAQYKELSDIQSWAQDKLSEIDRIIALYKQ